MRSRAKTKKGKRAKVRRVLHEFKVGKLRSSSGQKVTNRKQAIAIALSEAGLSRNTTKSKPRVRRISAARKRRKKR